MSVLMGRPTTIKEEDFSHDYPSSPDGRNGDYNKSESLLIPGVTAHIK
jgi:hypothetical protein